MHRLARRLLSFTFLAAILAGAAGPARAQGLEQLRDTIIALDLPSEQGMLHLIQVAGNFIDKGQLAQAIKPLNALAHSVDQSPEIDSSTADALLASVVTIMDSLAAGPQEWWCDVDGDGYTVYAGVSLFAPSAYCSNDPGLGVDADDNDPAVNGTTLLDWWCDYDEDGYTVYMGKFALPPSEYCSNDPELGPDSDDNDPYVTN